MADAAQNKPGVALEGASVTGQGTLFSWSLVHDVPAGYEDQAPYYVALVRLDDGSLVTAQYTDPAGEPAIGERVEMVTRKLTTEGPRGMIVYGYKFRRALVRQPV
jgi:uncharacterized OB-fold protein